MRKIKSCSWICSKRHTDIINGRSNTKAPSCSKAVLLRYKEINIFLKKKSLTTWMSSITLKTILFIRKIICSSAWSKRFAVYSIVPPNPGISENFSKNSFLALWSFSFTRAKACCSQSVHESLWRYHPLWVRKGLEMVNKEMGQFPDVWEGCSQLRGTNSAFVRTGIKRKNGRNS